MKKIFLVIFLVIILLTPSSSTFADTDDVIEFGKIYNSSEMQTYFSVVNSFESKTISHVPLNTSKNASDKRKFVYIVLLELSNNETFNLEEYIDEIELVDFKSGLKFPVNKELSKFVSSNHPRMKPYDYTTQRGEGREVALIFDIPEEMPYSSMYLNIGAKDLILKKFRVFRSKP